MAKLKIFENIRHRRCFTLIELLVAIAIIGVLVGMVLYTLAGARQDAKVARTQGTLKKISDVVLMRWEEFRYRAVKINIPEDRLLPYNFGSNVWQPPLSPREGARARMIVLRDVMRMELPDRYTDIMYPPIPYRIAAFTADNNSGNAVQDVLIPVTREVPGAYLNYRRKMVGGTAVVNPVSYTAANAPTGTLGPSIRNQSAELLYEIVTSSNYNGASALEYFKPNEIGDTDGDSFPEFLDAWGNPIRWIRWPAGYLSPLNDTMVEDAMDPLKTDFRWSSATAPKPWLLVPLVISAGPDGVFDLVFDFDAGNNDWPCVDPAPGNIGTVVCQYPAMTWVGPPAAPGVYSSSGPHYYIDPYFTFQPTTGSFPALSRGARTDNDGDGTIDGAFDNLSNYELILQ